jgi:hypothetical protein
LKPILFDNNLKEEQMTNLTTLTNLEQQLAALKAATVQPLVTATPASTPTLDDIRNMVKEMLVSELGGVLKPAVVPEKIITLEDALNSILTGDEQKWLLNAENVKKLPSFILSEEGKPLTQNFIREFRSRYGN